MQNVRLSMFYASSVSGNVPICKVHEIKTLIQISCTTVGGNNSVFEYQSNQDLCSSHLCNYIEHYRIARTKQILKITAIRIEFLKRSINQQYTLNNVDTSEWEFWKRGMQAADNEEKSTRQTKLAKHKIDPKWNTKFSRGKRNSSYCES